MFSSVSQGDETPLSRQLSRYFVTSLAVLAKMNTTFTTTFDPSNAHKLTTCSIWQSTYMHTSPSVFGNILFLGILSITAVRQLCLGMRYKTGLICVPMLLGVGCEGLGYIAQVLLNHDPLMKALLPLYLICLVLGLAFVAAAIYLCYGRIMVVYGEEISRLRVVTFVLLFMGSDVLILVVQVS